MTRRMLTDIGRGIFVWAGREKPTPVDQRGEYKVRKSKDCRPGAGNYGPQASSGGLAVCKQGVTGTQPRPRFM